MSTLNCYPQNPAKDKKLMEKKIGNKIEKKKEIN